MAFLHVEPDAQYAVKTHDGASVAFQCDADFARRLIRDKKVRSVGRPGKDFHLRLIKPVNLPRGAASVVLRDELGTGQQYTYITHFASGRSCHSLKRLMPDGSFERWPGE